VLKPDWLKPVTFNVLLVKFVLLTPFVSILVGAYAQEISGPDRDC
jgi:hypothetical protein